MYIRSLAVASLTFFLCVTGSAGAEDVKIMGLMDTHAARSDSTLPLAYLTGSCQKKSKRMKCHLNEIVVKKLDTTPFEAKATEVMEQVTNDPQNVDNVIERSMPYLCHEPTIGTDRMEETAPQSSPCLPESRSCGRPHGNSVQRSRKPICRRCWTSGSRCKRGPVRCGSTAMTKTLRYAARSG